MSNELVWLRMTFRMALAACTVLKLCLHADHNIHYMKMGPDGMLYFTIGSPAVGSILSLVCCDLICLVSASRSDSMLLSPKNFVC